MVSGRPEILSVVDTREYMEEGDRWVPIPGSGEARECDRCGRLHEVHATVQYPSGETMVVGTGCMGMGTPYGRKVASSASALARYRAELQHAEEQLSRREAAWDWAESLTPPAPHHEERSYGKMLCVGDGCVNYWPSFASKPNMTDSEALSQATNYWRRNRMEERTGGKGAYTDWRGLANELRRRIEKAEEKQARLLTEGEHSPNWSEEDEMDMQQEGIDRSTDSTVVEYAVQEMFKRKTPRTAARNTAKKLSGYENMFLGSGVSVIDAKKLEEALWERMVTFAMDRIQKVRPGMEHFAIGGTADHFRQGKAIEQELDRRVRERLAGHEPNPSAGYYRTALAEGDLTLEEALQDSLTDTKTLAQMKREVRKFIPDAEVYSSHHGPKSYVVIESQKEGRTWEIPIGEGRPRTPTPAPGTSKPWTERLRDYTAQFRDNPGDYYVWTLRRGELVPMEEGPYGPHDLDGAKTYARIAATEGTHDRVVSRGRFPASGSFEFVRRYEAGTGRRLL